MCCWSEGTHVEFLQSSIAGQSNASMQYLGRSSETGGYMHCEYLHTFDGHSLLDKQSSLVAKPIVKFYR